MREELRDFRSGSTDQITPVNTANHFHRRYHTAKPQTITGMPLWRSESIGGIIQKIRSIYQGFLVALLYMGLPSWSQKRSHLQKQSASDENLCVEDALLELRTIRESGIRDSERVVELWTKYLSRYRHKLGNDQWTILEQVFIAGLDTANERVARTCLAALRNKFPNSGRVNRLFAMYLESKGSFSDARAIYSNLLEDDPTNTLARKRMIAILKAEGRVAEAVEELRQYVKIFMSDYEAWNELGDLYLTEGDYKHAAFCYEEMILSNPHNHLFHQRYAEIKYTEGGTENLELARTHFAQAYILNPTNNLRSLFGLFITSSTLTSHSSAKGLGSLLKGVNAQVMQTSLSKSNVVVTPSTTYSNSISTACKSLSPGDLSQGDRTTGQFIVSSTWSKEKKENQRLAQWAAEQIASIYGEVGVAAQNTAFHLHESAVLTKRLLKKVNHRALSSLEPSLQISHVDSPLHHENLIDSLSGTVLPSSEINLPQNVDKSID